MNHKKKLIIVAGPTAIGKTHLAIQIAKHFNTEIISADSRQFYREMTIGTAKPSPEELAAVKHHFIDSHSVNSNFSVGDFEEQALVLIDHLFKTHDEVVLAGGSGLFIKAVTEGFDELPKADVALRDQLNKEFQEKGIQPLQEQLKHLDPVYYKEVDLNNPQRIIRALEVCLSTNLPFSSYRTRTAKKRDFDLIKIGLNLQRDALYQRINQRVDLMIEAGLIEEVNRLIEHRNLNALNTVGYSEIFDYIDGKTTIEEAINLIKQNTRRFAKRQLTWFRRDQEIKWFEPDEIRRIIDYIEQKQ